MKTLTALKTIAVSVMTTGAGAAFAHEGHGLTGTHWHATDSWGFVAVTVMVALAVWLSRGSN